MQATKSKRYAIVALLLIASIAVIAAAGAVSVTSSPKGAYAEEAFIKSDEVSIAHITDMHYYPLNYCYTGSEAKTEYATQLASSMKMVLESSRYNVAALDNILAEMPDYLVVTGDMTLNGEIQGHIEVANLLRRLQNRVRAAGKPNFQVFVIMGNHDMYNDKAYSYRDGSAKFVANNRRIDVTKIYSSLGYPDLTDDEIGAYYDSIADAYAGLSPYESATVSPVKGMPFVNSKLATEGFEYTYMYRLNGSEEALANGEIDDYVNGELSYVVTCPDNYVFIGVDEELSNKQLQHHLGAILFDSFADYLDDQKAKGNFDGKTLIGFQHHNLLPHFTGEESLLKDFTVYNYEEFADYYADLGMRYMYSGHMHANDIEYRVSLNGNPMTDIETASATGYGAATRVTKLQRGKVGTDYAENFYTKIVRVEGVDLKPVFEAGLMDDAYLTRFGLAKFVGSNRVVKDSSEYAGTKLFYNILENVVYQNYINVEFIGGLGDMVTDILPDEIKIGLTISLAQLKPSVKKLVDNIIRHIENDTLKDYTYKGDRAEFKSNELGAKLCGYADELITDAVNIKVNSDGDSLIDFVLGAYLKHVGGFDTSYADATDGEKEAMANFANGKIVKDLIGCLLDADSGLLPVVKDLFDPIDIAYGMTSGEIAPINSLLSTVLGIKDIDYHAFKIDDILPKVLSLLAGLNVVKLDMKGLKGAEFIENVIDSYVTEAFYTSLGEIAHGIVYAFSIDETAAMENIVGEYVLYNPAKLTASYVSGKIDNTPSVERGMLPSMLSVTFGANPATDKNFVWFTAKQITGTDIQYVKGEFDEKSAVSVKGETNVYVTTTANIDLGVFATLMHVEIARHTVELTGLESNATYSYRVGDKAKGYWSEVYTFTTAPAEDDPFEILLITDIQGSSSKPYSQAAVIMEKVNSVFQNGYDFIINCGDVVDNSRNLVQWKYLDILADYWANTTVVVTSGNHDKYTYEAPDMSKPDKAAEYAWLDKDSLKDEYSYLLMHYNLSYPKQNDKTGAYYSFDYSAVHFTVLNTNNLTDKGGLDKDQYEWLVKDLDSTEKKFKVVIMHKGLYSAGSHIYDTDVIALRKQLTSLFAEKGVALVLEGHDHTYSESYYIDKDGNIIDTKNNATTALGTEEGGVMYVGLGTFGDKFYNYIADDDMPLEFGKDLHNPTLINPTFGKLYFDGENLYYVGYEYDLDKETIEEIHGGMGLKEQIIIVACCAIGVSVLALALAAIAKARRK